MIASKTNAIFHTPHTHTLSSDLPPSVRIRIPISWLSISRLQYTMDRSNFCLAAILLICLGCSTVQSRKVLIYGRGGGPSRGWFAMNVMEVNDEPDQVLQTRNRQLGQNNDHLQGLFDFRDTVIRQEGLSRLWGSLRMPFEASPLSRTTFEKRLLPRFQRQSFDSVSQSFICKTCLDISTKAEQVLSDPDTLNQVLNFVNTSLCGLVMPGQQEECVSLAGEYIPEVFQMLQENIAPEHLCTDTKLCPRPTMMLLDNTVCEKCEEFATEALNQLSENSTETQVLLALHSACSKLGAFNTKCDILVDVYGPKLFVEIQSASPQDFCREVKLCNAFLGEKKSYCASCEYAILEMKAQLRNPVNQEKLLEVLSDECTKVPNYTDQCKEIVAQYGPFILANMDSLLDADTLCTKIHACEAVPASRVTPAIRMAGSEETKEKSQEMMEPLIKLPSTLHEHVVQ